MKTVSSTDVYYDFLRFSIGSQKDYTFPIDQSGWEGLFDFAIKQSIVGVLFNGISQLNARELGIPVNKLYNWIGLYEQIKNQNIIINEKAVEVSNYWLSAGFRYCVLKGQGNALMYPDVYSRSSGDIDIWVEGNRKDIYNFVRKSYPNARSGYTHIDFPMYANVAVEVHYVPSSLYSHKYNNRLQDFYNKQADNQYNNYVELPGEVGKICVPTPIFNIVHQMSHIMNHFFIEGIGLRQFVDYFFLLKTIKQRETLIEAESLFKRFGLYKFARGVMWVLSEVLGLEDSCLITQPDPKTGLLILKEIEEGGNFGFYDNRYTLRRYGALGRGVADIYRLLKLTPKFPAESLWCIERKLVHQLWKQ